MIIIKHNFFVTLAIKTVIYLCKLPYFIASQASNLMFYNRSYKKIISLILFIISFNVFSQENKTSKLLYFEPEFHYGYFLNNSSNNIFPDNYTAFDFKVGVQTKGENWWHKKWNYPTYGIGFYKGFYNSPDVLGNPFGIYTFLNGKFLRIKRFSFNYEYGAGVGYLDKYYSNSENNQNDVVSTPIEYFINIKFNFNYIVSERITLIAGAHFSHFSNGALQMPNYGMNDYGYNASIRYHFYSKKHNDKFSRGDNIDLKEIPQFKKNLFVFFGSIGGCVETYNTESPLYFMWSLSANYNRRYAAIASYGGGFDAFYDGSIPTHAGYENYTDTQKIFYTFHLSHVLHINKLDFLSDLGTYLNDTKLKGYLWARIGYRYNITNHFFAQISFKTQNGAKADFIEFAIGTKI